MNWKIIAVLIILLIGAGAYYVIKMGNVVEDNLVNNGNRGRLQLEKILRNAQDYSLPAFLDMKDLTMNHYAI